MRLKTSLVMLLCWAGTAATAEDAESLDEDFLTYLAEFEGDDDDWTMVEVAPVTTLPAKPANEQAPKVVTQPPQKTSAPKPATPDPGSKR